MLKKFMNAIFEEDLEDEEVEETKEEIIEKEPEKAVVEEEKPVVQPEPIVEQPVQDVLSMVAKEENIENSPIFEKAVLQPASKKENIFTGLDVDSITSEETKPKRSVYKYDRHKSVKVRRVAEDLDYQPVISPIFGNMEDSKKEIEKVHDAINLPKSDDIEINQILSPMFGTHLPSMEPAKEIPEYEIKKDKALNVSEMLEKPKAKASTQASLFDKED